MQSVHAHRSRFVPAPTSLQRSLPRRSLQVVGVQHTALKTAEPPVRQEAVLCTKYQAHEAAVTAIAVLKDEPGLKQFVTASLDKTLAVWTLEGGDLSGPPQLQCSRMEVAGGPVFSLQRGIRTKITDVNVKPREPVLFCGLAAKEIIALRPDTLTFSQQMHMNGHTGWVRSLASSGKYLFSCGCNHLHQWDQAYAVPKEVRSTSLFTGDILALAATDKAVFTAGADGSLRRWALGKLGELTEAEVRDKAHEGRITCLAVAGSILFSAGYDGAIKAWDVNNLQLFMEVKAAHAGERVRALVMGPTAASSPSSSKAGSPSVSSSSSPSGSLAPSPQPAGEECFEAQHTAPLPQQEQQQQDVQAHVVEQMHHSPEAAPTPAVAAAGADPVAVEAAACEYEPVPDPAPAPPVVPAASEYEPTPTPDVVAVYEPAPAVAADPASEYEPVTAPAPQAEDDSAPTAAAAVSEYEPAPTAEAQPEPEAVTATAAEAEAHTPVPSAAEAALPAGVPAAAPAAANGASSSSSSPASSRPSSPSRPLVLYSAGDDGLVRRWDARLLTPVGEPLTVHHGAVKALAVGEREVLVSGDASGEVAVWLL